jgi:hypothetical protein
MEDSLPSAGDPMRGWGDHRLMRIRRRKRSGPQRESEGFEVPLESGDTITLGEGRDPALFMRPKS